MIYTQCQTLCGLWRERKQEKMKKKKKKMAALLSAPVEKIPAMDLSMKDSQNTDKKVCEQ